MMGSLVESYRVTWNESTSSVLSWGRFSVLTGYGVWSTSVIEGDHPPSRVDPPSGSKTDAAILIEVGAAASLSLNGSSGPKMSWIVPFCVPLHDIAAKRPRG